MKILAERLRELRTENKLSQIKLANILFLRAQTISKYENDQADPSIPVLIALSKYFKVETDYLLGLID